MSDHETWPAESPDERAARALERIAVCADQLLGIAAVMAIFVTAFFVYCVFATILFG